MYERTHGKRDPSSIEAKKFGLSISEKKYFEKCLLRPGESIDNIKGLNRYFGRVLDEALHKMDQFVAAGVYSQEEVAEDKEKLNELYLKEVGKLAEILKNKGEKEFKIAIGSIVRGKILEKIIVDQIEVASWLGADCYPLQTEALDDRQGHADLLFEWDVEGADGPVRLAVDTTTSNQSSDVIKKIDHIKHDILLPSHRPGPRDDYRKGPLTWLKYGRATEEMESEPEYGRPGQQSAEYKKVGLVGHVPRVVIGTNVEGVRRLAEKALRAEGQFEAGEAKNELENEIVSLEFINIIKMQLEQAIIEIVYEYARLLNDRDIRFSPEENRKYSPIISRMAKVAEEHNSEELYELVGLINKEADIFDKISDYPVKKLIKEHTKVLDVINQQAERYKGEDDEIKKIADEAREDMAQNNTYQFLVQPWSGRKWN